MQVYTGKPAVDYFTCRLLVRAVKKTNISLPSRRHILVLYGPKRNKNNNVLLAVGTMEDKKPKAVLDYK